MAERFAWEGILGSPVAWLALILSLGNAYYNVFYYLENVRISLNESPVVWRDKDNNVFFITEPNLATFINSGNRDVIISDMQINFIQPGDTGDSEICSEGRLFGGGDSGLLFKPLVIKAGEIASLNLGYKDLQSPYKEASAAVALKVAKWQVDDAIDIRGQNKDDTMILDICLQATILSASGNVFDSNKCVSGKGRDRKR